MYALRQISAIVLLPGTVALVIPMLVLSRTEGDIGWGLATGLALLPIALGVALIAAGLGLIVWTVGLFASKGRGSLAPWDPTSRLVVTGPYRHVQNPMISGVLCVLLGEAALFGSPPLLLWFGIVLGVNAVYMPLVEEPGLVRRFGQDYEEYRRHVPRWLPRLWPWSDDDGDRVR